MKTAPVGVLLINIGTPASPEVGDVRAYLRAFLSDRRTLDMAAPLRWLLLNAVILPTRPQKSAKAYASIWTERGSPLLFHGLDLAEKLEARLGPERARVRLGFHYGAPNLVTVLEEMRAEGVDRIVCVPLYPQYSAAATGSALERVMDVARERWVVPNLQFVPPFYDHPAFVGAQVAMIRRALEGVEVDHLLFSYHGLPERHCTATDDTGAHCLAAPGCCDAIVEANRHCYRAQCFETTRRIVAELGMAPEGYTVAFQSRLGRTPWIQPYTDQVIPALAKGGVRRLAVVEPAFVADCLETVEEIGIRGRALFEEAGGESLHLVPCLNSEDMWADALSQILRDHASWL